MVGQDILCFRYKVTLGKDRLDKSLERKGGSKVSFGCRFPYTLHPRPSALYPPPIWHNLANLAPHLRDEDSPGSQQHLEPRFKGLGFRVRV